MILTTQRGGWIRRAGGVEKRWKTDRERSQRVDEELTDGKKVKICLYYRYRVTIQRHASSIKAFTDFTTVI